MDLDTDEEDIYQRQLEYLKVLYPDKQINIKGYGVVDQDTISNKKDLFTIISNNNICCGYCDKPIDSDNWIVVINNPKDEQKPLNLLFFCSINRNECAKKWATKRLKK